MVFGIYSRENVEDLVSKVYNVITVLERLKRPDLDINDKVKTVRELTGLLMEFKKYKEIDMVKIIYREAVKSMRGYTSNKALEEMLKEPGIMD